MMVCAAFGPVAVRLGTRGLLAAAIVLATTSSVSTGTFAVFGPRVYTRGTGAPVTVRDTFTIVNPSTQYSLRVRVNRGASAVVWINGVQVAGPSDFNATVTLVEKPVPLRTTNELAVQLRGQPGGALTIEVLGIDNDQPTITVSTIPPPNAQGWNNTPVTGHFTCADLASGIATCPPDQIVSTEGPNQTISGTATDNAGNSASASSAPFSIDLTRPLIAVALKGPISNGVYRGPVTAHFTCSDTLSGIATCAPNQIFTKPGPNQSASGTAMDVAGNTASVTSEPFTIVPSGPVITDFSPKTAPVGTLVTVLGSALVPEGGGVPVVTLSRQAGGTIEAPLSNATASALAFVIPTGASTGLIHVRVGDQTGSSASSLTIRSSSEFTLTAAPESVGLIEGQSTGIAVTMGSANGFSELADLTVIGVPAGIIALFAPARITAGQTGILTLKAPAGQPVTSSTLTIVASATADGIRLTQSSTVSLNVEGASTSFIGRTVVSDTLETPIAGVTVRMLGKNGNGGTTPCSGTTVSDAAGNFALAGLGPECVGPQLVGYDGLTATSPIGKYAGVNLVYTLQAGQVTESPVLVHLPRIDDKETFFVRQNATQDQTFAYQSIPGLSVTVYRGTTFRLEDGSTPDPFPLVAVQVPVDRLPDAKPPVPTMLSAFIVAFQPANAVASQPAAVFYPNTLNTPPGINMTLMTLDPTRGRMLPYGTATVSPGGTQIVPDLDPAFSGHRYGIVNFDWHGPMPPPIIPPPNPDPPNPVNPNPGGGGCDGGGDGGDGGGEDSGGGCTNGGECETCSAGANPVDVSSGLETVFHTDIKFGGQRGSISLRRFYRTLSAFAGPFGIGTHHNYGYRLDTVNFQSAALINLATPDGNRFPFTKELALAPPGSVTPAPNELRNFTNPAMIGAVMTVRQAEVLLRWKNGTIYRFIQPNPQFTPQLESIVDPNGNRITITRNPNNPNQISQITDPTGRSLRLTYDGASRITSVTDPIGRIVSYTYNVQGTLETVTDPEGGITRYEYDSLNRMTRETNARGIVVTQNTYDDNGRVATQTQADGGVFRFEYAFVNPTLPNSPILATTVIDPLIKRTAHRFTPAGFRTDATLTNGRLVAIDRHALTNKVIARRPLGTDVGKETFTYDDRGNLLRHTDALGRTTVYSYEATFNKVTFIRDPLGNTTSFTYDGRGNLQSRTDGNDHTTTYRHDSFGLLTEIIDATGQRTRFDYDTFGNLTRITNALGHSSHFGFDGASRLVDILDSLGRRRTIARDRLGRIVRETDANGRLTTFAYDPVGNLLSVTDARGKTTTFSYDPLNRLVSRTDPLGHGDFRSYDSNRNLLSFRDRRGQTSTFAYDDLDRLTLEEYADGSRVERRYDGFGRLVQATDSGMSFGFEYDMTGGLIRSTGPFGTVNYQRDALRRTVSRQVVGQGAATYTYDDGGNLLTAATPGAAVNFTYNARNEITALSRSNGVVTSYTYDPLGHVRSVVHTRGNSTIQSLAYFYDASGDRIRQDTSAGRPLTTQAVSATYDDAGRLLRRGNTSFLYDRNGNLTSRTELSGTTTYSWDARNRLSRTVDANGQSTYFQYDFAGNVIHQTYSGPAANLSHSFVLDSLTNVVLRQSTNGDQIAVLTGKSLDSHFATVRSSTQVEFGLSDSVNSTIATVDQTGDQKGHFAYEPFGGTTASGSTYLFQYTGRVPVSDSLFYYRARFYSTDDGRFISEDPVGLAGGPSLYAYARNNPIRFTDPTGRLVNLWLVVYGAYVVGQYAVYTAGTVCAQNPVACQIAAGTALAVIEDAFGSQSPPTGGLSDLPSVLAQGCRDNPEVCRAAAEEVMFPPTGIQNVLDWSQQITQWPMFTEEGRRRRACSYTP